MVSIELFQPGKVQQQLQFPSEWNELHLPELHSLAKALMMDEGFPLRAWLLQQWMEYRAKRQKIKLPKKLFGRINEEDAVINGYPLFDFVFSANTLTQQPYKRLRLPGWWPRTVHGPQDSFNSLTCGEYEDAHFWYLRFKEEHDPAHLAQLMAVLWRPAGKPYLYQCRKTNQWQRYNAEAQVKHFLRLPAWLLFTAYTWYEGCQNELQAIFHTIFNTGGSNQPADPTAVTRMIHAGAGPRNGTREQVRLLNLKEFLFDVQLEIEKANELKEAYESK